MDPDSNGNGHLTPEKLLELRAELRQARKVRHACFQRLEKAASEAESLPRIKREGVDNVDAGASSGAGPDDGNYKSDQDAFLSSRRNSRKYLKQLKVTCIRVVQELNGDDVELAEDDKQN